MDYLVKMKISFLGGHIVRGTGVSIVRYNDNVLKIPFSSRAFSEIYSERHILKNIEMDLHFCPYLPEYRYYGPLLITDFMRDVVADDMSLIEKYFSSAFYDVDSWKKEPLSRIIKWDVLSNFMQLTNVDQRKCHDFIHNNDIKSSSVHGDFCKKNILINNESLFFIDWSRYKLRSSRFFDVISFYIEEKRNGSKWTDKLIQILESSNLNSIYSIEIPVKYFLYYGLWRLCDELVYVNLNLNKRRKYVKFITELYQYL